MALDPGPGVLRLLGHVVLFLARRHAQAAADARGGVDDERPAVGRGIVVIGRRGSVGGARRIDARAGEGAREKARPAQRGERRGAELENPAPGKRRARLLAGGAGHAGLAHGTLLLAVGRALVAALAGGIAGFDVPVGDGLEAGRGVAGHALRQPGERVGDLGRAGGVGAVTVMAVEAPSAGVVLGQVDLGERGGLRRRLLVADGTQALVGHRDVQRAGRSLDGGRGGVLRAVARGSSRSSRWHAARPATRRTAARGRSGRWRCPRTAGSGRPRIGRSPRDGTRTRRRARGR